MEVLYNDWNMIYKLWCPHCNQCLELGHMDWSAILCRFCNKQIDNVEEGRNKIIEQLMEEELERLKKDNNGR